MSRESTYQGEILNRATSSESLDARLEMNKKYQSNDFNAWLFRRLGVAPGMNVLDVGCGTGMQTLQFGRIVGPEGKVCSVDLSEKSIATLNANPEKSPNITAVVGDMNCLRDVIEKKFPVKKFSLAHATYSLYYADDSQSVLDVMADSLEEKSGKLAIFSPNSPHGMVDFVSNFTAIPPQVTDCFSFGPRVLEPYFRRRFWDVTIHLFHNPVRVPTVEDFMAFYRATTYFDAATESAVKDAVASEIERNGVFEYEKNGYLILGEGRKL